MTVLVAYSIFNVARSGVALIAAGGWSLPTG